MDVQCKKCGVWFSSQSASDEVEPTTDCVVCESTSPSRVLPASSVIADDDEEPQVGGAVAFTSLLSLRRATQDERARRTAAAETAKLVEEIDAALRPLDLAADGDVMDDDDDDAEDEAPTARRTVLSMSTLAIALDKAVVRPAGKEEVDIPELQALLRPSTPTLRPPPRHPLARHFSAKDPLPITPPNPSGPSDARASHDSLSALSMPLGGGDRPTAPEGAARRSRDRILDGRRHRANAAKAGSLFLAAAAGVALFASALHATSSPLASAVSGIAANGARAANFVQMIPSVDDAEDTVEVIMPSRAKLEATVVQSAPTATTPASTDDKRAAAPPAPTTTVAPPIDIAKTLAHADAARRAGDVHGARMLYQRVLAEDPTNSEALSGVGDIARANNDIDSAEGAYRRVLAANPSYLPALVALGDTQWNAGDTAGALKTYRSVANRFSRDMVPAHVMARLAAPPPSPAKAPLASSR